MLIYIYIYIDSSTYNLWISTSVRRGFRGNLRTGGQYGFWTTPADPGFEISPEVSSC